MDVMPREPELSVVRSHDGSGWMFQLTVLSPTVPHLLDVRSLRVSDQAIAVLRKIIAPIVSVSP